MRFLRVKRSIFSLLIWLGGSKMPWASSRCKFKASRSAVWRVNHRSTGQLPFDRSNRYRYRSSKIQTGSIYAALTPSPLIYCFPVLTFRWKVFRYMVSSLNIFSLIFLRWFLFAQNSSLKSLSLICHYTSKEWRKEKRRVMMRNSPLLSHHLLPYGH